MLYNLEGCLKTLYFPMALIFQHNLCIMIAMCICLLAILRICKVPTITKEYAQKVLFNEFFMNLLYCICIYMGGMHSNIVFQCPLAIHFWIGLAEYIRYRGGFIYNRLSSPVEKTRQNRNQLLY